MAIETGCCAIAFTNASTVFLTSTKVSTRVWFWGSQSPLAEAHPRNHLLCCTYGKSASEQIKVPTRAPTKVPTNVPTNAPTDGPTDAPTDAPRPMHLQHQPTPPPHHSKILIPCLPSTMLFYESLSIAMRFTATSWEVGSFVRFYVALSSPTPCKVLSAKWSLSSCIWAIHIYVYT